MFYDQSSVGFWPVEEAGVHRTPPFSSPLAKAVVITEPTYMCDA